MRAFHRHDHPLPAGHPTGTAALTGAMPANIALFDPALEQQAHALGLELLQRAQASRAGASLWRDRLMEWATRDPAFKVQLFRFIDVFPTLQGPQQIHAHLQEYLSQPGVSPPQLLALGLKAGEFFKGATAKAVARQVESMAGRFIAGVDAQAALPRLRELWDQGIAFSIDLLGEACVSDAEAQAYQQRYLDLVRTLPQRIAGWPAQPVLERDHLGPIPRANVSIKISSLSARIKPEDFEGSVQRLLEALEPILQAAAQHRVLINFDMEQHALKDLTLELFMRCCQQFDFPAGIALQAYLRSGEQDAQRLIDWAGRTGRQVTVRLIKGAYWDYEVINAQRLNWPVPVWTRKRDTDACFERMAARFIQQIPTSPDAGGAHLALGSHNVRSIAAALALLEKRGLPTSAIEVQMLHGMAEPLKAAIIERGLRLREYVPVGQVIPGMAYLVRRLLENTSNESWLRAGFHDQAPAEVLLASPHIQSDAGDAASQPSQAQLHQLSPAVPGLGDGEPFLNEPTRDFADEAQRRAFAAAIAEARVPTVARDATPEQARDAVARAQQAFPAWRDTPVLERARLLLRTASLMRQRRDELAGVMIREAGKTWREADADVCEAIDFCEYYARQAVRLLEPHRLGRFTGELNEHWYQPRGVAAVISPWNFPLAICTGMTSAALVCGNATIVKPAEQTPGIAQLMCELMWQAGVPRDALQYLPGLGETIGAALVRDPRVAIIAFTGSKAVGLDILQAASHVAPDQPFIKRVVCEMGGKNAIIVDESADLDEAVLSVRQSAFGFAGQKCSACSRVIVVGAAREPFLRRLVGSTRSLRVGDPLDPATDVGPLIDEEAAAKVRSYIEIGKQEGRLELAMETPPGLEERVGKPFVAPHIFSDILPHHRLANEEIFGPVLAVMSASDFEEALAIANATTYKLTGGVFSRTPSHLDLARQRFRVGNLYLNRGITGALVGRQPFGGLGLSGVGFQAGGGEYLLQFVEPRSCCENTLRRGFSPEL
ncbi:MAG TPA: proline dehydrogenase family protein [Phycisphaeraceae bacterium]